MGPLICELPFFEGGATMLAPGDSPDTPLAAGFADASPFTRSGKL